MIEERILEIIQKNRRLNEAAGFGKDFDDADIQTIGLQIAAEARKEGIEEMRPGIEAVEGLIDNSHGVDGLHLNGDIAPWDELRTGGVYMEWLGEFDHALEKLKENR